jgi:signal transduction histidine kinase
MASTDETAREETVLSAAERRLARLRFDLHDGPQQDVHLLAMDLSLFREQLLPSIANDENRDRLLGRLDDLSAQLIALDQDLRRLATSVQSPFLAPGALSNALREIVDAFSGRTGIEPDVRMTGDLSTLTDSRQIALLALIREALSNIRKHSDATSVSITIDAHERGVDAEVVDNGRGFDPETTLARAARDGHLGVVGMRERVRMLGGETTVESRPGGPTVITVALPPWPPPAAR